MKFTVWMVILLSLDPVPTFSRVATYDSVKQCEADIINFVKENNLTDKQAKRISCIPVITSKMETA